MIGTIRKHSKGLWVVIIVAVVASFLVWGAGPSRLLNGGRGGGGSLGTLYGREVTMQDYALAQREFYIYYWLHYGEWPDRNPNLSREAQEQQIFERILLERKADDLGIHISEDQAVKGADTMLHSLGRNGQPVDIVALVKQFPEGMGAGDFERYVRTDLAIQQLIQAVAISGDLITPREAMAAYERDHQQFSAQAVFFSASNYLSAITAPPANVAQFYTNYLATYRLPDRVQVSYVAFELSNYLAQSRAEWAKTNLDEVVDINYQQLGPDRFPDAKTPEAAKAKIRDLLIQKRAGADATEQANDFFKAISAYETNSSDLLALVARQKGMTVHTTEPFGSADGPQEFEAPAAFVQTAFALTPDEPYSAPVAGPNALYVMVLDKKLPSEIPSFESIRARVTQDYRMREATMLAQRAGTNFVNALAAGAAVGHSFAAICASAGVAPVTLPPFSLVTQELPEPAPQADLNLLKQAAFTTPVGQTSGLMETADGAFVLYLQSKLPVDQSAMNADLPDFTARLRQQRENEAFNEWMRVEASREFRNIPDLQRPASSTASVE
jgi:hypothetical protein